MNEALVMSDFNHPNVLGLTGICIQEETDIPIIVLPYMEHGDLKTYLRHFRYDQDKADKVTSPLVHISSVDMAHLFWNKHCHHNGCNGS